MGSEQPLYMVKFLTFSIFTTPGSRTPSPLYLYIVKIECKDRRFSPDFDGFPKMLGFSNQNYENFILIADTFIAF